MKIIQKRRREHHAEYTRSFVWRDDHDSGFEFPCDATGTVNIEALPLAAQVNYRKCIDGTHNVSDLGVRTWESTYNRPAIGLCDACGSEVHLARFTNTCECGADYNMSGRRLASRSQWGEETGEHWTECY